MSVVDFRLALACSTPQLNQQLIENGYAIDLLSVNALQSVDILIIDVEHLKQIKELTAKVSYRQCFLVFENSSATVSAQDYNQLQLAKIISKSDLTEKFIFSHLEFIDQQKQDEAMAQMTFELKTQDQSTKVLLEQKIFQEQQELINRRQKILEANNRIESLRKILFSISEEHDVTRIETLLNELLPQATTATWIKIIPANLAENFEKDLTTQLPNYFSKKQCSNYFIYFIKGDKKPFKAPDSEMFLKVTDALHFNLLKSESQALQQQLEKIVSTAFNSTFYPLLIVDKEYNIVESNKAFHRYPSTQQKCYEVMFNLKTPCKGCQFGKNFQLQQSDDNGNHYYNVQSQKLMDYDEKNSHWVHFYSDITEEKMLEQRLSQTAKMKELGLISSSIAHELNNPLGGIISYLQILQMELAKDHVLQTDLVDMIKAADRMKHIIENLLIFSRKPFSNEKGNLSLKDIVAEAIKLNELQFKVENIKVVNGSDNDNKELYKKTISSAAFRDSVNLIFNFFIDGLKRARITKTNLPGLIEVKFSQDQINFYLDLQSNIGPLNSDQKTKNIYFLVIHKSLIDQGFQVELTEPNPAWVAVKVILPKQD